MADGSGYLVDLPEPGHRCRHLDPSGQPQESLIFPDIPGMHEAGRGNPAFLMWGGVTTQLTHSLWIQVLRTKFLPQMQIATGTPPVAPAQGIKFPHGSNRRYPTPSSEWRPRG